MHDLTLKAAMDAMLTIIEKRRGQGWTSDQILRSLETWGLNVIHPEVADLSTDP